MDYDERLFLYLRVRIGRRIVSRSKTGEFAALGSILAQMVRDSVRSGVDLASARIAAPDEVPRLEYVDASNDTVLVSIHEDGPRRMQVIAGRFEPCHRKRLLDDGDSTVLSERFLGQASDGLTEEQREEVAHRLRAPRDGVLEAIRSAIGKDGRFRVEVPLPPVRG